MSQRRAFHLILAVFLSGMVCSRSTGADSDDFEKILFDLTRSDRVARVAAFDALSSKKELPARALPHLKKFIDLEIEAITESIPEPAPDTADILSKVPISEDDVSLDRIKTRPEDYTGYGVEYTICGILRPSSYYNFGMRKEKDHYYSFEFIPITKSGKKDFGNHAHVYVPKGLGDSLLEFTVKAREDGDKLVIVRIGGNIDSDKLEGNEEYSLSHLEGSDWQYYNVGLHRWEPFVFKHHLEAIEFLGKGGSAAIPVILGYLGSEEIMGGGELGGVPRLDLAIRLSCRKALESMGYDEMIQAIELIKKKLIGIKLGWAKKHMTNAIEGIRSALPEAKRSSRGGSSSQRSSKSKAGTRLQIAKNLEKSRKKNAAIDAYRSIIKDFPDSPEAKTATERLEKLTRK